MQTKASLNPLQTAFYLTVFPDTLPIDLFHSGGSSRSPPQEYVDNTSTVSPEQSYKRAKEQLQDLAEGLLSKKAPVITSPLFFGSQGQGYARNEIGIGADFEYF